MRWRGSVLPTAGQFITSFSIQLARFEKHTDPHRCIALPGEDAAYVKTETDKIIEQAANYFEQKYSHLKAH